MKPQPQKITNLATAGVTFTLLRRKEKRPIYENWQNLRYGPDEANKHVAQDGNLGVHLGRQPDGTFLDGFDADYGPAMSKLLAIAPELRQSLAVWRVGGSSKIIFRTDAPLGRQQTPDLAGEHTKLELIVGGQAAIFGGHPAGDDYHCNWKPPISLTPERVKDIWLQWTGQPWNTSAGGHNHEDAGPPDAEAVQHSMTLVETVLTLAGVPVPAWKVYNGDGRKVVLDKCPFNPTDDPHAEDRSAAVVIGADGKIGSTCHHARCKARIQQHGGGGWSLLKDLAGYAAPAPNAAPEVAAIVAANRLHLRALDFADHVPLDLQAKLRNADGEIVGYSYRTDATDRRIADVALGMMAERHKTTLRLSTLELSERTGLSSHTCKAAMARLVWLFAPVGEGAGPKSVQMYELVSCVDRDIVNVIGKSAGEISRSTQLVSGLPLSALVGQDVFVRSLTKLTPDALADLNELRRADGFPPVKMTREVQRRLDAITDSAGPGVLLVIDAIATYGGAMDRSTLATVMHRSKYSVSRLVTRGIALGLLLDFENRIDVHPDWENQVGTLDAICTTTGTMQRRRIAAIDARLRYTAAALDNPTLTPEERDAMYRRKNRAQKDKMDLTKDQVASYNERAAAADVPPVQKSIVLAPGQSLGDFLRWQRQKLADRRQAQESLRSLAGDLAGLERDEAIRIATIDGSGWTAAEVAKAMSYRQVV